MRGREDAEIWAEPPIFDRFQVKFEKGEGALKVKTIVSRGRYSHPGGIRSRRKMGYPIAQARKG